MAIKEGPAHAVVVDMLGRAGPLQASISSSMSVGGGELRVSNASLESYKDISSVSSSLSTRGFLAEGAEAVAAVFVAAA
jgi:hypothetical protein